MKKLLSMAPMEGLTGYVYRRAHHSHFLPLDAYYTPFISNKKLGTREKHDILPEHNANMHVIPQILTNKSTDFMEIEKQLYEYGYREVNLNLGCPSATVTAKGRGAGFLKYPEELSMFLDEIYSKTNMEISIKTRIGTDSEEEWPILLEIFNRFPIKQLTIHPRLLKDFYKGNVHINCYNYAQENALSTLCYNGDIHCVDNWKKIRQYIGTKTNEIMLGRGLLKDPALAEKIAEYEEGMEDVNVTAETKEHLREEKAIVLEADTVKTQRMNDKEAARLKKFHDAVLEGYCEEMSGDRNVLFKMKELWVYMGEGLQVAPKLLKSIKKANSVREYKLISEMIFREI